MNSKQVKLGAATLGSGALIAMGIFGVSSGTSAAQDEPTPPGPATSEVVVSDTTVILPDVSATQPMFPG
ncbi:hypothetical protein [Mycolicibacterium tusciae]|uniref:hypothetical protein n=1 Tax=Mycolicibacterium tusciae TaxID=75922 RepID=UPI00024A29E3|nr:hypothetical protein [Mycolicibacterium tusciae]